MNIMTVQTSDPKAFKQATSLLKKLNVTINVVEQDDASTDDDFEKLIAISEPAEEVYSRLKQNMKKHFNEKGENINLLNRK